MRISQWFLLLIGIFLCLFWSFAFLVFALGQVYILLPFCGLILGIVLYTVVDLIKALSANNGSSHEKSE